jgi:hypothetical protein
MASGYYKRGIEWKDMRLDAHGLGSAIEAVRVPGSHGRTGGRIPSR